MQYEQGFGLNYNPTPIQCKNGPLQQRKCTDAFCCIFYLLLIGAVIAFAVFSANAISIPKYQLQAQMALSPYGQPFIALGKSFVEICLALICVIVLCFAMVIISFIVPQIVAYIFIPISLIFTLLLGSAFIYVYFGQTLPFLSESNQSKYVQKNSILALGIGIALLSTFGFIIFIICTKKQRFEKIVPVLKIAKCCFWQNFYMIFISIILSIISLIIWYFNILFLQISQDKKDGQQLIDYRIATIIIVVQILWTHGIMEGLSDFIFQSFAVHWYFNNRKYGDDYSRCGKNCSDSVSMLFNHIGTVAFGFVNAYIPQEINAIFKRCEDNCNPCYKFFCCCHRFTLRQLSKYGYCQTVLQSLSYCSANSEAFELKKRLKSTLPSLYMQGNFFMTICKSLILTFSLIVVYFLLIQQNEQFYLNSIPNLLAPLIVLVMLFQVTLFISSEICNHFINATGLVGDTILLMYTVDLEIQRNNFGGTQPYSCPNDVRNIIREYQQ